MTKTITVTTTKKKPSKGGRTLRISKQKRPKRTTTVVSTVTTPSKNRKRRFSTALGITDTLALQSTDKLLHSLFVGTEGISRGIAFGSDMTSLTKIRGAFDISLVSGGRVNLSFCPTALNGVLFTYNTATQAVFDATANPYLPFLTGAGITAFAVNGPFVSTTPATGWRIVRASLRLIPTTNALNQGGWAIAAHLPILYSGNSAGGNYQGPTTIGDFENIAMLREFSGLDSISYQFFPGQGEIDINTASSYSATSSANGWGGCAISINAPSAAVTYHVQWEVGVEYTANAAYRPYVDRRLPDAHPDALFYMNQFVSKHWIPAVFSTVAEWEALAQEMDPVSHEYMGAYHMSGKMGLPTDYARQALFEEEKLIGTPRGRSAYEVITDACESAENNFGINPCKLGMKAVGAYTAGRLRGTSHTPMYIGQ